MAQKKGKLFYLLICLVFILFIYPAFDRYAEAGKILALFFSAVLVAGVYAISSDNRTRFIIAVALAIPTMLLLWTDQLTPVDFSGARILDIAAFSMATVFTFYTAVCILIYVVRARKVTADILAGAASTYLLLGMSWGMLYSVLELAVPGSFIFNETVKTMSMDSWSIFNYYSFTTLTTLGYGDITPVTSRAQSFAILEAVTGVLFTAMLVARLVGMYLYHQMKGDDQTG